MHNGPFARTVRTALLCFSHITADGDTVCDWTLKFYFKVIFSTLNNMCLKKQSTLDKYSMFGKKTSNLLLTLYFNYSVFHSMSDAGYFH